MVNLNRIRVYMYNDQARDWQLIERSTCCRQLRSSPPNQHQPGFPKEATSTRPRPLACPRGGTGSGHWLTVKRTD